MKTDEISTNPVSLKSMVEYAKDSIVSKVLHKTPNNVLTLFAFDGGQEISEHTTPFEAYVIVVDGEMEITIGGKKHTLGEGDFIRMPGDIPHAIRAGNRGKMVLVMVK